jgi:mycothiol synthase
MADEQPYVQLQMIWPRGEVADPFRVPLPMGYVLRTYRPGDEPAFFHLMHLAGFAGWDEQTLRPWKERILPEGWFFAVHAETGTLAATAMTTHRANDEHPFGGELSWVAGHPEHAGKGLGRVVCAAVVRRYLAAGYRNIYLKTDDWRLPAIKSYLRLGFVPLLFTPAMVNRWETICTQLNWTYTPDDWPVSRDFHMIKE